MRQKSSSRGDRASEKSTTCRGGQGGRRARVQNARVRGGRGSRVAPCCRNSRAGPQPADAATPNSSLCNAQAGCRAGPCLKHGGGQGGGGQHGGHEAGQVGQPPHLHARQLLQLVPQAELQLKRLKRLKRWGQKRPGWVGCCWVDWGRRQGRLEGAMGEGGGQRARPARALGGVRGGARARPRRRPSPPPAASSCGSCPRRTGAAAGGRSKHSTPSPAGQRQVAAGVAGTGSGGRKAAQF